MSAKKPASGKGGKKTKKPAGPTDEEIEAALKRSLERERALFKQVSPAVDTKWRQTLRENKLEQLQKDRPLKQKLFQAKKDTLDYLIKLHDPYADRDEEDDGFASHYQQLEVLTQLFQVKQETLLEWFEIEKNRILQHFNDAKLEMEIEHQKKMTDLKLLNSRLSHQFAVNDDHEQQECRGQMQELKNNSLEQSHALKIQTDQQLAALEAKYQQGHQAFMKATDEKRKLYDALKKKDYEATAMIERQTKKLNQLQEQVHQAKYRFNILTSFHDSQTQQQKELTSSHYAAIGALKKSYRTQTDEWKAKMTSLAVHSNACLSDLSSKIRLAERVIFGLQSGARGSDRVEELSATVDGLRMRRDWLNERCQWLMNGMTVSKDLTETMNTLLVVTSEKRKLRKSKNDPDLAVEEEATFAKSYIDGKQVKRNYDRMGFEVDTS